MINHLLEESGTHIPAPSTSQPINTTTPRPPMPNNEHSQISPHTVQPTSQTNTHHHRTDQNTLQNERPIHLPPIYQPTLSLDNKPVTRSQHGIFKQSQ